MVLTFDECSFCGESSKTLEYSYDGNMHIKNYYEIANFREKKEITHNHNNQICLHYISEYLAVRY